MLVHELSDAAQALRQAVAERHLERVRTLLTAISADQAMVVQ